jgi:ribosomal protein L11 methyltransferase
MSTTPLTVPAKPWTGLNRSSGRGKKFVSTCRVKDHPKFTCAVFQVPAAAADDTAAILVAYGALGCEVKKIPQSRRPGRSSKKAVQLHAYFHRFTPQMQRRIASVTRGLTIGGAEPVIQQITDPGWATLWQSRFSPLPIGRGFLIVPPWHRKKDGKRDDDRATIVIKPAQAFGTGHHPSTLGTLNLMEEWCETHRVERGFDVGTGSGILAIAMHKLGAKQIVAIDIDAIALENARENAELNGIDGPIRFSMAPAGSIRGRFDLITANILSSVLIGIAPILKTRMRPGGGLILAGILKREAAAVVAAFAPELRCVRTRIDKAWAALLIER